MYDEKMLLSISPVDDDRSHINNNYLDLDASPGRNAAALSARSTDRLFGHSLHIYYFHNDMLFFCLSVCCCCMFLIFGQLDNGEPFNIAVL